MKVVLADLKSNRGFVSKDTVVGGYGSRLDPFSRVTAVMAYLKQQFHDVPSVHMAYIAAIQNDAPAANIDADVRATPTLRPLGLLVGPLDWQPRTRPFSPKSPRGPPLTA